MGLPLAVQVAGQAADRGEHRVVAAAGQRPQHRADRQGAAVGVQGGDGRADGAAGVAGQQQAGGDGAAERAGREPVRGHQPDRPVRPEQLRDRPGAGGEQPGRVGRDGRLRGAGAVADPVGGAEVWVQGAQEPAAGRLR